MTLAGFDDELVVEEASWIGRFIAAGVLLLLVAIGLGSAWYFFSDDEAQIARATEDIPVGKKTIATTLLVSGVADAQLSSDLTFQSSGKVASVNVKTGDVVRKDQVLAQLDADSLNNAVQTAQANARSAQLRLDDLLDGSTAAEIATAEQGMVAAEAGLTKARNDYDDLLNDPSAADLAAAEGAVRQAEAQLAGAELQLQELDDSPSNSDVAAAEAGVAAAEAALESAQNSAQNADNSVTSAGASLRSLEAAYCLLDGTPDFCGTQATPISSDDATILNDALIGANASAASAVIGANSGYLSAVNSAASADASVESAENALESAEAKLELAEDGPSDAATESAEAAVTSAQAALKTAQERLADVQDGADDFLLANAAAAVTSAESSLESARARRDEALRGPTQNAIEQQRQAVRTAQLSVEAAQIRLEDAQIISPFDGTMAAVNIKPGEFVGPAAAEPAMVVLTPDAMQLLMDIGETDYPNVKVGQSGGVRFDGLPASPMQFAISEIGLDPDDSQGVVTYAVTATLTIPPGGARPAPGMNGSGLLTVDSKPDVIAIPSRAVRRRGSEQIVDVRRGGGVDEQVITTGVSDAENVEVISGLVEGDVLVVPALRTAADNEEEAVPTLPGGVQ
ncbi:MAG: biotin/lipoyl-binding protein [Dehalococcoidia bacterium]